jgi:tetratricopeptide (TPR) repeat protein
MRRYARLGAEVDFRRGRRELSLHRPDQAVRSLRKAVDQCPAARAGELSRKLYWLALALFRLDRPELAIRSLASAQKLRPRGIARSAYTVRVNDYGMCRRESRELDDFYAFYSLQACAYLGSKEQRRFDTSAEKDAVTRLIGDAWRSLSCSGKLAGLGTAAKLELFKSRVIAYPFFGMSGVPRGRVMEADFRKGARVQGEDRCKCGSGLPFMRCCGRIGSLHERSCE